MVGRFEVLSRRYSGDWPYTVEVLDSADDFDTALGLAIAWARVSFLDSELVVEGNSVKVRTVSHQGGVPIHLASFWVWENPEVG